MRKIAQLLAAGVVAAAVPMSAQAVVTVTVSATPYDFAIPAGLTPVFVDTAVNGASLTGGSIVTGSGSTFSAPATGPATFDSTPYLLIDKSTATLTLANLSSLVSLYWGSIDGFNTIDLLNGSSVVGTAIAPPPANGGQSTAVTNARVNISSTVAFNGIRFNSTGTAFELDNVAVGSAVPEAATWMMMLAGFGMMGFAMRRRPRTAVTFG